MALGDGIRRNIALVEPRERALLRDAFIELNKTRFYPGNRNDTPLAGGVSEWFKQDEIHQSTHVHDGPMFLPWHRELVNRFEDLLRGVNSDLSLHYWDWTQDPRAIPNANLGNGNFGTLNLFTSEFMGYGGDERASIGEPWRRNNFYVPNADNDRDDTGNPADPPSDVFRSVGSGWPGPATFMDDISIFNQVDFRQMTARMEAIHNNMHGFVNMGLPHIAFRDPFVFLLHSNVDRLFALWQNDPEYPERLDPAFVYGSFSNFPTLNEPIPPWSGVNPGESLVRPWAAPENLQDRKTYKDSSVVTPRRYHPRIPEARISVPNGVSFGNVIVGDTQIRQLRIANVGFARLSVSVERSSSGGIEWNDFRSEIFQGETRMLNIIFRPTGPGLFRSTLTVESNDINGSRTVDVRGFARDGIPPFKIEF